ncbi:Replication protein A 70 kDa DNA-binding subunit B, partial [Linum grandiflorum]
MTLNESSELEEVVDEEFKIPETKFNFVPIDHLGPRVNSKQLVDIIGVVQSVSPTMSVRRKRDSVIVDESKKTAVVELWNELATGTGQELLDIAGTNPVVAVKALKVGDFEGKIVFPSCNYFVNKLPLTCITEPGKRKH